MAKKPAKKTTAEKPAAANGPQRKPTPIPQPKWVKRTLHIDGMGANKKTGWLILWMVSSNRDIHEEIEIPIDAAGVRELITALEECSSILPSEDTDEEEVDDSEIDEDEGARE